MTQSPVALQYSFSMALWGTSALQHPSVILSQLTQSCKTGGILGMLGMVLSV